MAAGLTPRTGVVRVLVADDHPIVLDGVTTALQRTSWLEVVGYARNGRGAIETAARLRPDVVLLDLRLPDMLGSEVTTGLLAAPSAPKVILFTAYPEHAAVDAALAAGAHGVLVKDTEQADLVDAIRRVVDGERLVDVDPDADGIVLRRRALADRGVSRREYDILRRVAMGQTNPEIAAALGLTRNTVKTYLQRLLEKLDARNRVEAIVRANELGLL
jgi:two-component system nitrate/nitrite response regulator NarL